MIQTKKYQLSYESGATPTVIKEYINQFWSDVFKPLHKSNPNTHLLLMVKVQFKDSTVGYRSLANMRKVNFGDKNLFIDYIINRLDVLSEAYKVDCFNFICK